MKKYCESCKVECYNLSRHLKSKKHLAQIKWNEDCNISWNNDGLKDEWGRPLMSIDEYNEYIKNENALTYPIYNQYITWLSRFFHFIFHFINVIVKFVTKFH